MTQRLSPTHNRILHVLLLGLICSLQLLTWGCSSGPPKYPVKGQVNWNGQPVDRGHIVFRDPTGKKHPDAGPIINGTYQIMAQAGEKVVEITGERDGPRDPNMGTVVREQYISKEYQGENSLLKVTIEPQENSFDFLLPLASQGG